MGQAPAGRLVNGFPEVNGPAHRRWSSNGLEASNIGDLLTLWNPLPALALANVKNYEQPLAGEPGKDKRIPTAGRTLTRNQPLTREKRGDRLKTKTLTACLHFSLVAGH